LNYFTVSFLYQQFPSMPWLISSGLGSRNRVHCSWLSSLLELGSWSGLRHCVIIEAPCSKEGGVTCPGTIDSGLAGNSKSSNCVWVYQIGRSSVMFIIHTMHNLLERLRSCVSIPDNRKRVCVGVIGAQIEMFSLFLVQSNGSAAICRQSLMLWTDVLNIFMYLDPDRITNNTHPKWTMFSQSK